MKISASIYSDKNRSLKEVIDDLVDHQVDMLHIDCNDDPQVFKDIAEIRKWCDLDLDLHLITDHPEKYYEYLKETPVEYITFQHESLKEGFSFPKDVPGSMGIAITTPTPIDVFEQYTDADFVLLMATTPGQSGGVFNAENFAKIRQFRKKFRGKPIHVDGGVNGEVSFILRNMGVRASVSGSYLFNAPSIGHALMDLTKREIKSHFEVVDFMTPIEESPFVSLEGISVKSVLETIRDGHVGFCVVVDKENNFKGIISNADVRNSMLNHVDDFNALSAEEMINNDPIYVEEHATVQELLRVISKSEYPIMFLPVLGEGRKAKGIVTFLNLIKGEL